VGRVMLQRRERGVAFAGRAPLLHAAWASSGLSELGVLSHYCFPRVPFHSLNLFEIVSMIAAHRSDIRFS
jgi:hypothetical protein